MVDGFGPPTIAYARAVAAAHYDAGADGVSLFNFTCADGPCDRALLTELGDPARLAFADKQYVFAVWPPDAQIYYAPWTSRFRIDPGQDAASYPFRLADDLAAAEARGLAPAATLTVDLMGVNRMSDIAVTVNGARAEWDGRSYNHYDHGCWNDVVRFAVPAAALRRGDNAVEMRRLRREGSFDGAVEARKCILDVTYARAITPGRLAA